MAPLGVSHEYSIWCVYVWPVLRRLEECRTAQVKALTAEMEEQRSCISQMEKEMSCLQLELAAQKEANVRSPSNTMKNLVERLKAQLAQKEKQLKVVPLLFL